MNIAVLPFELEVQLECEYTTLFLFSLYYNLYFKKNYKYKSKFVPEGVEARVLYKGSVEKIIYQLQGGLRSSMGVYWSKKN